MAVTTRVVRAPNQSAIGTVLDVAAQHRRSTRLDRRHHAALGSAETFRVGVPICRAVAAENIRHLQRGTHRIGSGRRRHIDGERGRLQKL